MVDERTADLVRQTYSGEVLGSALFARLVELQRDPQRQRSLLAAQLLEEQTLGDAEALARDLDVACSDGTEERAAARSFADALGSTDWPELLTSIANATESYRELYGELQDRLGVGSHPTLTALVTHERALHGFAEAEADGKADAINHLLGHLRPEFLERLAAA